MNMEVKDLIRNFKKGLTCSICLGYFNNPVTVNCGHTFCTKCLLQRREDGDGEMACPECKEFTKDLGPKRSTKNLPITRLRFRPYSLKSMVDLTICNQHEGKEKLFCEEDQKSLSASCVLSPQQKDHQILSLQIAANKCKEKLQQKWSILQEQRKKFTSALYESRKREVQCHMDLCAFRVSVMAEYEKMYQFLWNEKYQYLQKLTQESKDHQTKCEENMATLSQQMHNLQRMKFEVEDTLQKEPLEMLKDAKDILQRNVDLLVPQPEVVFPHWTNYSITGLREFFLSFYRDITLDPNTANPHLIVSEDLKSVTYRRILQDLPDNRESFDQHIIVLGVQTFTSGKHYWEVDMKDKANWAVGVCKDSVSRNRERFLVPDDMRILVGFHNKNGFFLWHPQNGSYATQPIQKVGIFLDYERGHVAFYNAIDKSLIYRPPDTNFRSPLRPCFSIFLSNDENIPVTLIICPRSNLVED